MSAATQRYPAPAVQFPLRRSPVLAGALTFLNAAALLVLLAWMRGPHTYTREDTVEISCHGGPVPMREVLRVVLEEMQVEKAVIANGAMEHNGGQLPTWCQLPWRA